MYKTLEQALIEKGYTFLTSLSSLDGVPREILLGKRVTSSQDLTHKTDFYEEARKVSLPYNSGQAYSEISKS